MGHALPRQATTGQYRSGRPFDHFDCPNMSGNYVQVSLCDIPIGVCFDQVQQFLCCKGSAQHVYPWEAGEYLFELAFTRCRYDDDWERLRGNSTVEVVDDGMVVLEQSDLHPDDFLSRGFYSLPGLTIADRPVKVNAARLTAIALVVSS